MQDTGVMVPRHVEVALAIECDADDIVRIPCLTSESRPPKLEGTLAVPAPAQHDMPQRVIICDELPSLTGDERIAAERLRIYGTRGPSDARISRNDTSSRPDTGLCHEDGRGEGNHNGKAYTKYRSMSHVHVTVGYDLAINVFFLKVLSSSR